MSEHRGPLADEPWNRLTHMVIKCPFCLDWIPPELWDYETETCTECEVFVVPGDTEEEEA